MTHLRDHEFVDWVDGTLPPARVAHLRSCDACRTTAAAAREALAVASAADHAGDPSPLFWEQFGRRVNEAIDATPVTSRWFTAPRFALAALAMVTIVLLGVTLVTSRNATTHAPLAPAATAEAGDIDNLDADTDWAVVRAAADDLDLDDAQAAGLAARPGTADRMALELTAAERAELLRLVQAEFKSGA